MVDVHLQEGLAVYSAALSFDSQTSNLPLHFKLRKEAPESGGFIQRGYTPDGRRISGIDSGLELSLLHSDDDFRVTVDTALFHRSMPYHQTCVFRSTLPSQIR